MADTRPVMSVDDYNKLREFIRLQNHAKALELVKNSIKPRRSTGAHPRSEIYLDGSFTSDEGCQVPEYVISPLYISLQNESVDVFQHLLTLCPILLNELLPTIASSSVVYCYDCETFLHLACRKELIKIIQYLLKRGANVEIQGCRIGTPLHIAAEHGRITAIGLLLDSGADIEARDCSGNTPLHLAVAWDMLAAVHLLLDRGADINATSYFGDDVFSIAISRCAENVLTYLCNRDTSRVFSSPAASPGKILPSPPPLLLLAASSKKKSISVLFNQLIALPECPPSLKVDALLINGCCGVFSTNSQEKFKHALRMKQDLGQHKVLPSPPWYGGQLEVQSVEEWEEMQARALDLYLQSCISLDRCLGSDHPMVYQRMIWFIDYCASGSLELDCIGKLQLRCLDMFISRECLKLDYCSATPFQAQQLIDLIKYVSLDTYEAWIGRMLKGLEVFAKMREKHSTCTFFKLSPTPFNDPFIKLMETILNLFHAWISGKELYQEAETNCGKTHFRDLVEKFVRLCNSTLNNHSIFNVTWPKNTDIKSRNSLKFLLKALLHSEAVSFINMADPRTGLRPLHKAFHVLGIEGVVLMLSHGAHLDVPSRKHYTFLPGTYPTSSLMNVVDDSELSSLLSSPLPLLCQCSWAILRYQMPYRQLNLPSRIKDYIALHETV